jgi:predicted transcriptional regulator YdeE/DNA-binding transcriptional MerR regulator
MIKIGDFSKLAHVTVKTLHHYDQMGLLKPAHIDRFNGYRYYTLEQLPRLNRVLALKDLGFSLEEVRQMVGEELDAAELRGMLRLKQSELKRHLESEQARLERIENRLQEIERAGRLPASEVVLKPMDGMSALAARVVAADDRDLLRARLSLRETISSFAAECRLRLSGSWFALQDNLEYIDRNVEIKFAGVLQGDLPDGVSLPAGPVEVWRMPPVERMACVIHSEGVDRISSAYTALYQWTQSNGYRPAGPCREVYLYETPEEPSQNQLPDYFEVQCPVERPLYPVQIASQKIRKEERMEPKFETRAAFDVVGVRYFGKNENNEIAQLWDVFNARAAEIPNADFRECYGICGMQTENGFEYIACSQVTEEFQTPKDMITRHVPENTYAVFPHYGRLDGLAKTYEYIYQTWLPQAGYELAGDYDMEMYNEEFVFGQDESVMYILLPVKKKGS